MKIKRIALMGAFALLTSALLAMSGCVPPRTGANITRVEFEVDGDYLRSCTVNLRWAYEDLIESCGRPDVIYKDSSLYEEGMFGMGLQGAELQEAQTARGERGAFCAGYLNYATSFTASVNQAPFIVACLSDDEVVAVYGLREQPNRPAIKEHEPPTPDPKSAEPTPEAAPDTEPEPTAEPNR